jgi:outer membrane protein assembly factor BamB
LKGKKLLNITYVFLPDPLLENSPRRLRQYGNVFYIGTDSEAIVSVTPSGMHTLCKLENAGPVEGMAISDDYIFAGFRNNLFAAFNKSDGKLLWKYETKGPVISAPIVHDKFVYFSTSNGFVYALTASTGGFKWRYNAISKASSPIFEKDITYGKDAIIVGNDRQHMYVIDAKNGDKIWEYERAGGELLINGPNIFATSVNGTVYSIDKTSGRPVWSFSGDLKPEHTDFALSNTMLVFGNGNRIIAMDSRAGEGFKWQKDLHTPVSGAPIVTENVIYASNIDGVIYAFDLATGNEISHLATGKNILSFSLFEKNKLFIVSPKEVLIIETK